MPSLAILPIPTFSNRSISSCRAFNGTDLFLPFSTTPSSFTSLSTIRMGGGPRTFPGGVSKWQWKRMQEKKSKQLLKARLCRERQLYEMRKRAELKAAISELERPWEAVERAPVLFSVSADEQIKALADRFQRTSGFDMWSERDGPRLFPKTHGSNLAVYGSKMNGNLAHGSNQESYFSDSELVVTGSRKAEEEIVGHFDRHGGNLGSKMNGDDMVRRWGLDSRFERGKRHSDSYGSQSELAVNGSTMKRDKLARDFARPRMQRREMSGGFDRRRGRGSHRSHSELKKEYNEGEIRHSDSYRSQSGSSESYSRMQRQEMSSGFDRRRGRGGTGGNRSSHRSHSQLEKEYNVGEIGNASAGGFDRRSGNRGSYRSYSELALADSRSGYRNVSAGGFENRNSYGSESEIENAGFRKGRIQNTGGRDRDYSDEGRVSLRSKTDLRMEEGGDGRRVRKWSEGRNNGFMSSRGTRRP